MTTNRVSVISIEMNNPEMYTRPVFNAISCNTSSVCAVSEKHNEKKKEPSSFFPNFPITISKKTERIKQNHRLLDGSGEADLLMLRSSLPRALSHFLVLSVRSRSSSSLGFLRWMKLQKPPRTHPSPELRRQQASRKSVTGLSSQ
jgi:hypothetical protein